MTKIAFLLSLNDRLSDFPREEVEERLTFYSEMIEDHMEEGLSEEEAVASVGTVEDVAAQIVAELTSSQKTEEKADPSMQKPTPSRWQLLLVVLGAPIWLSLLVSAFAVILSLCVSLWAALGSFWAVFGSVSALVLWSAVLGVAYCFGGSVFAGIAMIGGGIFCAGLSIFLFLGCRESTRGMVVLTKKAVSLMKKLFRKKEGVQ